MSASDLLIASPASKAAVAVSNRALLNAATLVFVAGNAIWAAGLAPPAALAVLFGCCGVVYLLVSSRAHQPHALLDAPADKRLLINCGALALALCLLGGETHLFWAFDDWLIRDSVLADVVRRIFPVFYRFDGESYYLRAPLGMYMIPGVIGHALGLMAAHVALLTQNAFLLTVILYFSAMLGAGLATAVLLVIFSGLDILPWVGQMVGDYFRTGHWEQPARGVQWWAEYFQYSRS
jgi:hypothetical protein